MAEAAIGSLVVLDDTGRVLGVCTDRDVTIRVTGARRGPGTTVREACTDRDLVTISPTTPLTDAATMMRKHAVRRLPVIEDGRLVGVISIGDLAVDPHSALADISAADPDR